MYSTLKITPTEKCAAQINKHTQTVHTIVYAVLFILTFVANNKGPIYSSRLCHCTNKMEFIVNSFRYYYHCSELWYSAHTRTSHTHIVHPIQIVFFAQWQQYITHYVCASLGSASFWQQVNLSSWSFFLWLVCLFLRACECSALTLFMIFFLQCFAVTIHLNEIFHQYSDANES